MLLDRLDEDIEEFGVLGIGRGLEERVVLVLEESVYGCDVDGRRRRMWIVVCV